MVIAKILGGYDNNSYMYINNRPYCCENCGYPIKREVNQNFELKKKQMDVSYTYDGYLIVSYRFKSFCKENNFQNIVFNSIESQPDFFFLESIKVIPLDYLRRNVQFIDLCSTCNQFAEVIGATPSYLGDYDFKIHENNFYKSEFNFGSYSHKAPLIIVSIDIAKLHSIQKFKGLFFDDVLS